MNSENQKDQGIRVNCNVYGDAARILSELKDRHIIDSNREAVVQGLLALQERVTKSDIEKSKLGSLTDQRTYLKPWQEIIGTLTGIETTETDLIALLTCTFEKHIAITIQGDRPETERVQKLLGRKIAILKTDNPQKPLVIRTIPEPSNSSKTTPHTTKPQLRHISLSRDSGFAFCFVGVD
jgi:uncharacterized linocin/CFP29 family protein